jgi:hypothetical protein
VAKVKVSAPTFVPLVTEHTLPTCRRVLIEISEAVGHSLREGQSGFGVEAGSNLQREEWARRLAENSPGDMHGLIREMDHVRTYYSLFVLTWRLRLSIYNRCLMESLDAFGRICGVAFDDRAAEPIGRSINLRTNEENSEVRPSCPIRLIIRAR